MRIGSLFTGYGGLDIAAEQHFDATTAWTCDIDAGASKIINYHWPDIPNLHDITQVDWAEVEPVDILVGGWPCQPFSLAGKQKGAADERALWPHVAETVRALRPRWIVLENVAAITTAGELGRALSDLAALRYVGQWRCLRAADIGAPHGRARIFILAQRTDSERRTGSGRSKQNGRAESTGTNRPAAHTRRLSRDTRRLAAPGQETSGRAHGEPAGCGGASTTPDAGGGGWREEDPRRRHMVRESGIQSGRDESPSASRPHRHAAADTNGDTVRQQPISQPGCWYCGEPAEPGTDCDNCGARQSPADTESDTGRLSNRNNRTTPDTDGLRERRRHNLGSDQRRPTTQSAERRRDAMARECSNVDTPPIEWGQYEPAIRRWESILRRLAPPPTERSPKGSQRLSPAFVEWMMGLPAGWVTDVPDLTRNAQLKALGNGVVPQQALAALEFMQ